MSTGCTMTMKEYQRNKHHYMHQSHDGDIVLKFSDQEKTSSYKQSTPQLYQQHIHSMKY